MIGVSKQRIQRLLVDASRQQLWKVFPFGTFHCDTVMPFSIFSFNFKGLNDPRHFKITKELYIYNTLDSELG